MLRVLSRSFPIVAVCLAATWISSLAGCGGQDSTGGTPGTVEDGGMTPSDGEPGDANSSTEDAPSTQDTPSARDVPFARDTASPADTVSDMSTSSDMSTDVITEEEWARKTGPVAGEHDIERHISFGCPAQRVAQNFRVLPTVGCRLRQGNNLIRDCDVEPYCTRHDQCQDKPFGRCRGSPSSRCAYPIEHDVCADATSCTALPNGFCTAAPRETFCYPTGRCDAPERRCNYRDEPCEADSDCATLPGGVCEKRIISVRCVYEGCMIDADCGQAMRCACAASYGNVCVPADCQSDGDCGAGQECRLETGCFGSPVAYHCSTVADSCRVTADCGGGSNYCVFRGSWQCEAKSCPPPPVGGAPDRALGERPFRRSGASSLR